MSDPKPVEETPIDKELHEEVKSIWGEFVDDVESLGRNDGEANFGETEDEGS